jgi:alkaline phosphatase D
MKTFRAPAFLAGLILVAGAVGGVTAGPGEPLRITHGIAAGDATASSVVIWSRASAAARMVVEYSSVTAPSWPLERRSGPSVGAAGDFTGKVVLDGLAPDTRYLYWVRFVSADGTAVVSETGQFKTAPADDAARPVSLVWWGDIGGQDYCRDPDHGYALFIQMARLAPDLAIANGDSVYTDYACSPVTTVPDHPRNAVSPDPETAAYQLMSAADPRLGTPAEILAAFRAKWKYNLEDEPYRRFRAQTAHVYQWDDHEVVNDWAPGETNIGLLRGVVDPRPMSVLLVPGRRSLFEFTPIRPHPDGRIYRSFRLGRQAELFVVDARSHRDENLIPDGPARRLDVRLPNGERRRLEGKAKTMLGAEQREWLLAGLREAQARGITWKIVSTDVPLSIPTGGYTLFAPQGALTPVYHIRDSWAAGPRLNGDRDGNQESPFGFESELRQILAAIKTAGIKNVVFVATDVHHARLLRYEPGGELAGLIFHEFVAGPANAGSGAPGPLSRTFNPLELFARGRGGDPTRPSFLNFGALRIAGDGLLTVEIRDADGAIPQDARGRVGALTLAPAR